MFVYYKLKGKVSYLRQFVRNRCSLCKITLKCKGVFSKYKYIYHCTKQEMMGVFSGVYLVLFQLA